MVSAGCIMRVAIPPAAAASDAGHTGWQTFRGGIRYMAARPYVLRLLSVKACSVGLAGGMVILIALFAENIFEAGAVGMGMLFMARGLGALLGPLLARRLVGEEPQTMVGTIGAAFVMTGGFYVLFGATPTLAWAALALFMGDDGVQRAVGVQFYAAADQRSGYLPRTGIRGRFHALHRHHDAVHPGHRLGAGFRRADAPHPGRRQRWPAGAVGNLLARPPAKTRCGITSLPRPHCADGKYSSCSLRLTLAFRFSLVSVFSTSRPCAKIAARASSAMARTKS